MKCLFIQGNSSYAYLGYFYSALHTLKFLLYVPVFMPVQQYILCTAKTAQCSVRIIGALEYVHEMGRISHRELNRHPWISQVHYYEG